MSGQNTLAVNIPKSVPLKYREMIQHWDDERDMGNSLIVSLRPGYKFNHDVNFLNATHVLGFDTVKEAISELRDCIVCACKQCAPAGEIK